MANLIDKDALVAEIERLINEIYKGRPFDSLSSEQQTALWYVKSVMSSINFLEVKEVDLEKAIDDYIYTHDGRKRLALELDWKCCNLTLKGGDEIINFAKHFFELGLKAQKGE